MDGEKLRETWKASKMRFSHGSMLYKFTYLCFFVCMFNDSWFNQWLTELPVQRRAQERLWRKHARTQTHASAYSTFPRFSSFRHFSLHFIQCSRSQLHFQGILFKNSQLFSTLLCSLYSFPTLFMGLFFQLFNLSCSTFSVLVVHEIKLKNSLTFTDICFLIFLTYQQNEWV